MVLPFLPSSKLRPCLTLLRLSVLITGDFVSLVAAIRLCDLGVYLLPLSAVAARI